MDGEATKATAANIYVSKENEKLTSVGVYTNSPNDKIKIQIFTKGSKMSYPIDGTQQTSATTTVSDAGLPGFHVIDLKNMVELTAGQYFSVMVTLERTGGGDYIAFSTESTEGHSVAGQSFYLTGTNDGEQSAWVDGTNMQMDGDTNNSACIFAYTSDRDNAAKKTRLDNIITAADKLTEEVVEEKAGSGAWTRFQSELSRAKYIQSNPEEAALNREIRVLGGLVTQAGGEISDGGGTSGGEGPEEGFYEKTNSTDTVQEKDAVLYVSGAKKKQTDGTDVNYKSHTYYIKQTASDGDFKETTTDAKTGRSKTKTYSGKLLVGVTMGNEVPALNKGAVVKDNTAANIASAAYNKSANSVTVTAKNQAGEVYVWAVIAEKKGAQAEYTVKKTVYLKMSVKLTPTKLVLVDRQYDVEGAVSYTKDTVAINDSVDFYIKPIIDKTKTIVTDASYTVYPAKGMENYAGDGKATVSGEPLTVEGLSGSYASFHIVLEAPDETTAVTATINVTPALSSAGCAATDKPKIYMLSSDKDFIIENGKVEVTGKPAGRNAKITASIKDNVITLKAPKKLQDNAKTVLLVVYNTYSSDGYFVMPVSLKKQ